MAVKNQVLNLMPMAAIKYQAIKKTKPGALTIFLMMQKNRIVNRP